MKRKAPSEVSAKRKKMPRNEILEHEDTCPICLLILLRPVTTTCKHTLCAECMSIWAEVSITRQMEVVGLNDSAVTLLPSELESACPLCRTLTIATSDRRREDSLRRRYPRMYVEREVEARSIDDSAEAVETLTLYIGNTHSLIKSDTVDQQNKHKWSFFVRPSRTDLIEEVQVFLVSPDVLREYACLMYPSILRSATHV